MTKHLDAATKVPAIVCIDVEPDGFYIDRTKKLPWKGYEACFSFFSKLRPKLKKATGSPVHYSWFYRMDPQVAETYGSPDWAVVNYHLHVEELKKNGDEIGLHPHAWRWEKNRNNWIEDHSDQTWLNHCVDIALESYEQIFHQKCKSFRFGARFMNNEIVKLIEEKGIQFDLTLEPDYQSPASNTLEGRTFRKGEAINYSGVPRRPYYPSREDYKIVDAKKKQGLCMIPLTAGSIEYKFGRAETLYKQLFSPKNLAPQSLALNLAFEPRHFRTILEHSNNQNQNYIAAVLRSEIGLSREKLNYVEDNLNYFLS